MSIYNKETEGKKQRKRQTVGRWGGVGERKKAHDPWRGGSGGGIYRQNQGHTKPASLE